LLALVEVAEAMNDFRPSLTQSRSHTTLQRMFDFIIPIFTKPDAQEAFNVSRGDFVVQINALVARCPEECTLLHNLAVGKHDVGLAREENCALMVKRLLDDHMVRPQQDSPSGRGTVRRCNLRP
jgi:hypothetical protein